MNDKNKSDQIKIYGKENNINVKNFETLDEFQQFYDLHKSEINELSTVKLNRLYHIKDYKITRRKLDENNEKTLCFQLKKNKTISNSDDYNECEKAITELRALIKSLEYETSKIKEQVIEIVKAINGNN